MLVLSLLAALPAVLAENSVTCGDQLTCDIYNDTLIGILEAFSLNECSEICLADTNCNFYTYFDNVSFPFTSDCFMFNSCNSVHYCDHCVSEARHCRQNCNKARTGKIGQENLVDFLNGIGSEFDCRDLCVQAPNCSFFTYFNESDPEMPNMCALLSHLIPPIRDCEHCWSGPKYSTPECSDLGCSLTHNGMSTGSLMLTESSMVDIEALTECRIKILAVGGGGKGSYGGGGSGFVEGIDLMIPNGARMNVTIGGPGEDTVVQLSTGDILTALRGGDAASAPPGGGKGYSGGGYGLNCHCGAGQAGGSNGEDGGGGAGRGGEGSHLNISKFNFDNFQLEAGKGGLPGGFYSDNGGGGGGVVINGKSPDRDEYTGEGYGGGGGLPGAVILEIQSN